MRLPSKTYAALSLFTLASLIATAFGCSQATARGPATPSDQATPGGQGRTDVPSADGAFNPGVLANPGAASEGSTCARLLADNNTFAEAPSRTGISRPDSARNDSARADSAGGNAAGLRNRSGSASFAVGGSPQGAPDIILRASVQADQVRFASQPRVRVRLCWGGDTLRVVQRENLPSPVVAGTIYRNVYVAVELLAHLNAECVADLIGVGSGAAGRRSSASASASAANSTASAAGASVASAGGCAFLGGTAGAGAQTPRSP